MTESFGEYKPLMTSHMLVRAWEYVPASRRVQPSGSNIAIIVASGRLKRVLIPNIFVQCSEPLRQDWITFFLHDDVIPRLACSFVYAVLLLMLNNTTLVEVVLLLTRIAEIMPFLQTLSLTQLMLPFTNEVEAFAQSSRIIQTLPAALWGLTLNSVFVNNVCSGVSGTLLVFSDNNIRELAAQCPLLVRLDLCYVTDAGSRELFHPSTVHFPRLRRLAVDCTFHPSLELELYNHIFASPLVAQLESLTLECPDDVVSLPAPHAPPSLPPLGHLRQLGFLFQHAQLSSAPSLSSFVECRELNAPFYNTKFPNGGVTIDLGEMPRLEVIMDALLECGGVERLILPSSLRHLRGSFCFDCHQLQEIDFEPCKTQLHSVELDYFCSSTVLTTFDTSPFAGKILHNEVGTGFLGSCENLISLDLSGLVGARKLGGWFLEGCTTLNTVTGTASLSKVEEVGRCFLYNTFSLEQFNFSDLASLRYLGKDPLRDSLLEEEGLPFLKSIAASNQERYLEQYDRKKWLQEIVEPRCRQRIVDDEADKFAELDEAMSLEPSEDPLKHRLYVESCRLRAAQQEPVIEFGQRRVRSPTWW